MIPVHEKLNLIFRCAGPSKEFCAFNSILKLIVSDLKQKFSVFLYTGQQ